MLIVGYGPRSGYFLAKNSYGLGWGQNGYCYIPEDFITRGIIFEMWAFEISPPPVIQP
jgi:C1A family cysteine protease